MCGGAVVWEDQDENAKLPSLLETKLLCGDKNVTPRPILAALHNSGYCRGVN